MLLYVQMPGAQFVAPGIRWRRQYGWALKTEARPLVILQPMGPVMFVFDVSNTEPGPKAIPLPKAVNNPFEGRSGHVGSAYDRTIENAKRDGVKITTFQEGSQSAGSIMVQESKTSEKNPFLIGKNRAVGLVSRNSSATVVFPAPFGPAMSRILLLPIRLISWPRG